MYTKNRTRRLRRQRQLREALKDPVLLIHFEDRFLKTHKGDKQKALQAIDNLRARADQELSEEEDTKGEERKIAAKMIDFSTYAVAVLYCAFNQFQWDLYHEGLCHSSFFPAFSLLVHMADNYWMRRQPSRTKMKQSNDTPMATSLTDLLLQEEGGVNATVV